MASRNTSVLSPKYAVFCCDQNGPPARRKEGASRTSLTSRRTNQGRYKRQTGAGRDRRATQPPAHFHRNPLGRGQLAVFSPPRRNLRQNTSYFGDRTLARKNHAKTEVASSSLTI